MPSSLEPAYYDRPHDTAVPRLDYFMKWATEHSVAETGEVDSPVGYVALVPIDNDLLAVWFTEESNNGYSYPTEDEQGWYIVRIDSNGLVWGLHYGDHGTYAEQNARLDFAEAEKTYEAWGERHP